MSCPFFEPLAVAALPERIPSEQGFKQTNGRLPLIEEYDGLCHAASAGPSLPVPTELRRTCCNMGNSNGACSLCPEKFWERSIRFTVSSRSQNTLDVLCIEEERFAPVQLHRLSFSVGDSELIADGPGVTISAQALAFCKSYLARFQAPVTNV